MTGRPAGYSPEEYVSKLADFSDDNKFLNSITVSFEHFPQNDNIAASVVTVET